MERDNTMWYDATGCDTMDDEGIAYFLACNDAKEYVARINEADETERIARIDALCNHIALCATCRLDATLHTDSNGVPL